MEKYGKTKAEIGTPYDDVFRTLIVECPELVIPVINEVFKEKYTGQERIRQTPNEHFIYQQDGDEEKRITDSSFEIVGATRKKYHLECQSTKDGQMIVRMFEYDTQIALEESEVTTDTLTVEFPNSAIMFLRHDRSTPDVMKIVIKAGGGQLCYEVPVMKAQNYALGEIFEKKLYFLIPFYIFSYEKEFAEIEKNEAKLHKLHELYKSLRQQLETLAEQEEINEFVKCTLVDMTKKVIDQIARKYVGIRKGLGEVMGGKVLEYEAKTILNKGREQGREQGLEQKGLQVFKNALKRGLSVEEAQLIAEISDALVEKALQEV